MAFSQTSTQRSKRSSFMQTASTRLTDFGYLKSKKEGKSGPTKKTGLKISPPYNFRNMNDEHSASNPSARSVNQSSKLRQPTQNDLRSCPSPLDKPLPSLPCATVVTKSPAKARRSLIDAEERPLRRSISPTAQTYEEWPSLCPKKRHAADLVGNSTSSISNGTEERSAEQIPKLKSDGRSESQRDSSVPRNPCGADDTSSKLIRKQSQIAAPDVDTVQKPVEHGALSHGTPFSLPVRSKHGNPFVSASSPSSVSPAVKNSSVGPKLHSPVVRQNKASELRIRAAAGTLEAHKDKRAHVSAIAPAVTPNAADPGRSTRSNNDAEGRNATATHSRPRSRSRSRHLVTSQGSPHQAHITKAETCRETLLNRKNSLVLDSDEKDTSCSGGDARVDSDNDEDAIQTTEIIAVQSTRQKYKDGGRNSTLLPSQPRRITLEDDHEDEMVVESASRKLMTVDRKSSDFDHDSNRSNDADYQPTMKLPSVKKVLISKVAYGRPDSDSRFGTSEGTTTGDSNSTQSLAPSDIDLRQNSLNDSDNEETFTVKELSKANPEHGPKLRISSSANQFILGDEDSSDEVSDKGHTSDEGCIRQYCLSSDEQDQTKIDITPQDSCATKRDEIEQNQTQSSLSGPSSRDKQPTVAVMPNKQAARSSRRPDEHGVSLRSITNSAPPVQPGMPKDAVGWPFSESVVAPFKISDTPDLKKQGTDVEVDAKDKNASSPRHHGDIEPSPGYSVRSKFDLAEALEKIRPVQGTPTKSKWTSPDVDDTHNGISKPPYPPRISSRQSGSFPGFGQEYVRTTGYRTKTNLSGSEPLLRNPLSVSTKVKATGGLDKDTTPQTPKPYHEKFSGQGNHSEKQDSAVSARKPNVIGDVDDEANDFTPSLATALGTVPTGRGVIKNIRGYLHHKRSHLHSSLTGSVSRRRQSQYQNSRDLFLLKSPNAMSEDVVANSGAETQNGLTAPPQIKAMSRLGLSSQSPSQPICPPCSPQADGAAQKHSPTFPAHKGVRPFADTKSNVRKDFHTPVNREVTAQTSRKSMSSKDWIEGDSSRTDSKPDTRAGDDQSQAQPEAPSSRSQELESAIDLVYHLLDRAQKETRADRKDELVEFSKSLVSIVNLARDTERALEEAKQAAAKCEIAVVGVKKEIVGLQGRVWERVNRY